MKKVMFVATLALTLFSYTVHSAPTKVGNGDDGSDLEGFNEITKGSIVDAKKEAMKLLQSLNIYGVAVREFHGSLENVWGLGDNLLVAGSAKFASDGSEDASSFRFFVSVDDDASVVIEADTGSIRPACHELGADDNGALNCVLTNSSTRSCCLDGDDNNVTNRCVAALRATEDFDAHTGLCTSVIGYGEDGLLLDHDFAKTAFFVFTTSESR
jgi:hypothetical protein